MHEFQRKMDYPMPLGAFSFSLVYVKAPLDATLLSRMRLYLSNRTIKVCRVHVKPFQGVYKTYCYHAGKKHNWELSVE